MLSIKIFSLLLEKGLTAIIKNSTKEGPTLGIIICTVMLAIGTILMDSYTTGVADKDLTAQKHTLTVEGLESEMAVCLAHNAMLEDVTEWQEDQMEVMEAKIMALTTPAVTPKVRQVASK